jgi:hypothetical protein
VSAGYLEASRFSESAEENVQQLRATIQATGILSENARSVSKAMHSISFDGTFADLKALRMYAANSLIRSGVSVSHPKLKRSVTAAQKCYE